MEEKKVRSSVTDLAYPLHHGYGFDEVEPIDFYRELFPEGEFQKKGEFEKLKYNEYIELPCKNLYNTFSYTSPSTFRLMVLGKAEEVFRYFFKGLKDYQDRSVYLFGSDASEEYETAYEEYLTDYSPICVAESYEEDISPKSPFNYFKNLVEFPGSEDRLDIVLLKDNYPEVQREFLKLVLNYKHNNLKCLHIFIEDKDLYNEFKNNKLCTLYDENFFAKLLKAEIESAVRVMKGYEGNIDVNFIGNGNNNVALAKLLKHDNSYVKHYFYYKDKQINFEPISGMIFLDTGSFENDLFFIKLIRERSKTIPIYWLHSNFDEMVLFKYHFYVDRLYPINKVILDLYLYKPQNINRGIDENSKDEEKLDTILLKYSKYGIYSYKLKKDNPKFDKSIVKKAHVAAKNKDFKKLKEIYKTVDENNLCSFEDFANKGKDISDSIFGRLEILYYLGKYGSVEDFDMKKLKIAVLRYAEIIKFAGGYVYVSKTFKNLLNYLIPYFKKCDRNDRNLKFIFELILTIYKVYHQQVDEDVAKLIRNFSK